MFFKTLILLSFLITLVVCETITTVSTDLSSISYVYSTAGEWKKIEASKGAPPLERPLHACAVVDNKMFIFGGRTGLTTWSDDLRSFNFDDLSWHKVPVEPQQSLNQVPALVGHTMTQLGSDLYVFGGRSGLFSYNGDLYKIDTKTETIVKVNTTGTGPSARQGHTAIAIDGANKLLIHGGNDGTNALDDTYILDIATLAWTKVASSGVPAEGQKSISTEKDGQLFIYVFGGYDGQQFVTKIRIYDVTNNSWSALDTGKARAFHTAIRMGSYVYLFGGVNSKGVVASTSIFSLSDNTWLNKSPSGEEPSARQGHCAVVYGSKMVIWGGNKDWKIRYNDMWWLDTQPPLKSASADEARDLRELVEEAIARVALSDEKKPQETDIERDVSSILQQDKEIEVALSGIPETIRRCHDIEVLNNDLQSARKNLDNSTTSANIFLSAIDTNKRDYEAIKKTIDAEVDTLRSKLKTLEAAELKFREEQRNTAIKEEEAETQKSIAKSAEIRIDQTAESIRRSQSRSEELKMITEPLNRRLEELTRTLGSEEETHKQTLAEEKTKMEQLENIRNELATVEGQINKLEADIYAFTTDLNSIERKLQGWDRLANEADDVKRKLQESIKAEEKYASAKGKFLDLLKGMKENVPSDVETEQQNLEKKEKDLDWINNYLEEQRQTLSRYKKEKTAKKQEFTEELRKLQAKQHQLKDSEQRFKNDLDRIRERLASRASIKEKTEKEKADIEKQLKDSGAFLQAAVADLEVAKVANEKSRRDLGEAKQKLEEAQKQLSAQQAVEDEANRNLDAIRVELKDLYEQFSAHWRDAGVIRSKLDDARTGLSMLKLDYGARRNDMAKFRNEMDEKMRGLSTVWAERLEKCEQEKDALKAQVEALQKQLAALQQKELPGTPNLIITEQDLM